MQDSVFKPVLGAKVLELASLPVCSNIFNGWCKRNHDIYVYIDMHCEGGPMMYYRRGEVIICLSRDAKICGYYERELHKALGVSTHA